MKKDRKEMKRIQQKTVLLLLAICCGLMVYGLSGCGLAGKNRPGVSSEADQKDSEKPGSDKMNGEKLQVVATIFPAYDFARQIGGDGAEVRMLLSPGEELQSHEPSPKDIIAIEQCDVFIYVGGESDTWVNDILDSIDTSQTTIIAMMDIVEALEEETIEGMDTGNAWAGHNHEHDHAEGDYDNGAGHSGEDGHVHNENEAGHEHDENESSGEGHDHEHVEYDEHVWTSPENAKLIVEKIADEFCMRDQKNETIYRENEAAYLAELETLTEEMLEIRENAVRTMIIVGDRFPFRYLAEFMDLEYYAAFPGCAEETEPSAKTVAFLIDKVKEEQVPVVFYGEFSSHLMAERICEEAGGVPLLLHSCHNATKDEFETGVTYLDLMWQNAENLREALK